MVLANDNIDLAHFRVRRGVHVGLGVITGIELHVLFYASIHCSGGEYVANEVDLRSHDDSVRIEPPNPLGTWESVESINDCWKFRPNLGIIS